MSDESAGAGAPLSAEPTDDPVEALARRAASGDGRALDELLRVIRPIVLRRCQRVLENPADAEEACQDALVAVARRIGSFEGRARFSTWLYAVASNAAVDTHRKVRRRASETGTEDAAKVAVTGGSSIASSRVDLLDAMTKLSPTYAEPVAMRDFQGLSYDDIAAVLDVPVGTVKSRIHEARRQLRDLLAQRY